MGLSMLIIGRVDKAEEYFMRGNDDCPHFPTKLSHFDDYGRVEGMLMRYRLVGLREVA